MGESNDSSSPLSTPPPATPAIPPEFNWISLIFWGANGLRAGWRLLIFFTICAATIGVFGYVNRFVGSGQVPGDLFSPEVLSETEATVFGVVLFASWVMANLEGREIAAYGLPWRRAFRGEFWKGAAIGFAAISFLLGALRVAGAFHLGGASLHGAEIWRNATLWACAFLFVAFFEEFAFRGYALFTLTTGITFWPAALLGSAIFGGTHLGNGGETRLGAFSAGMIGLLFCLLLRKSGSLWMPIGFHAAWDWGQTFFYGVADSGQIAQGHLFNASFTGPDWLTGGTVGPEASWLCILLIGVLLAVFSIWMRAAKYPDPASVPDPRRLR
jgi:hypothetical protein